MSSDHPWVNFRSRHWCLKSDRSNCSGFSFRTASTTSPKRNYSCKLKHFPHALIYLKSKDFLSKRIVMQVSRAWRQGEFAGVRDVFHPSLSSAGQNVRKTASQGRNYHATFAQGRMKSLKSHEWTGVFTILA